MEFEKYTAYIAPKGDVTVSDISTRLMTTMELLTDANSKKMGELVWRIGLPFMSVLLMLLADTAGFRQSQGRALIQSDHRRFALYDLQ